MNLKKHLLYLPKKLQKPLLLIHQFQVIIYFAYSLRRYTILFQKLIVAFIYFSNIWFWELNLKRKSLIWEGGFQSPVLKRDSQKFLISFSCILGSVISWSLTIILLIWLCIPLKFSRFKKNLENFSPSPYHWHLLLMCIPPQYYQIFIRDLVYICRKDTDFLSRKFFLRVILRLFLVLLFVFVLP